MTASKTVLRQDLWTDQLKNMQSGSVELSLEDKTKEMLVVGMERDLPGGTQGEVLAKGCASVEEGGDKQGVPNQNQGTAGGDGQVKVGDICDDRGGRGDGLVDWFDSLPFFL